jgi:ankyrin repeat protein
MSMRPLVYVFLLLFCGNHEALAADAYSRMHSAIEKNDVVTVRTLLRAHADPNVRRDTRASPTYLTQAARLGRTEIVKALIAAGADVNAPDGDNMTPLMHASQNGHGAIVEALLRAKADVTETEREGKTALDLATAAGHSRIAATLLNASAKSR